MVKASSTKVIWTRNHYIQIQKVVCKIYPISANDTKKLYHLQSSKSQDTNVHILRHFDVAIWRKTTFLHLRLSSVRFLWLHYPDFEHPFGSYCSLIDPGSSLPNPLSRFTTQKKRNRRIKQFHLKHSTVSGQAQMISYFRYSNRFSNQFRMIWKGQPVSPIFTVVFFCV